MHDLSSALQDSILTCLCRRLQLLTELEPGNLSRQNGAGGALAHLTEKGLALLKYYMKIEEFP